MSDADHFRNRALDCRALAKRAATNLDASLLREIADELDAEAELIESRKAARTGPETHHIEDEDAPAIIKLIAGEE